MPAQSHLQVREAGHEDLHIRLGPVHRRAYEVVQRRLHLLQLLVQPQPRVRRHLRRFGDDDGRESVAALGMLPTCRLHLPSQL
jgi:hypothetical protein